MLLCAAASGLTGMASGLPAFTLWSVLGIFLGFFAYDYAWYLYTSWLPGYLRMERHVSAVDMGIYSSVPFVVMAAIILLSGLFSDAMIRRGFREVAVRKAFIIVGLV